MGFATGYYFLNTYIQEKKKTAGLEKQRLNEIILKQNIEKELISAQNSYLKAQINPHFLFNTLDYIYHNVMTESPPAAEAIIILSEMMRYAIDSDKMGDFVIIGDELEQVENLFYLNQLRRNDPLNINFKFDESVKNLRLIPLVLLTVAENIFKHGNINRDENPAELNVYLDMDRLVIETFNAVAYRQRNSHHSGLKNIQKRLQYAYGDDAEFRYYVDDDENFNLRITVPISCL